MVQYLWPTGRQPPQKLAVPTPLPFGNLLLTLVNWPSESPTFHEFCDPVGFCCFPNLLSSLLPQGGNVQFLGFLLQGTGVHLWHFTPSSEVSMCLTFFPYKNLKVICHIKALKEASEIMVRKLLLKMPYKCNAVTMHLWNCREEWFRTGMSS